MAAEEWRSDAFAGFVISTDPTRLDRDLMWEIVRHTYWGANLDRPKFERSVDGAIVFGLYDRTGAQAGFARAVTDYARFAWLSDLFVVEGLRGRGLGRWLIETVLAYPPVAGVNRWLLATRDAQDFYRSFGFVETPPGRYMVRPELK